jgi:adenylate cyclase
MEGEELMEIVEDMISELDEHAETVEDRLDHIPESHSMPDLEDMSLYEAKEFNLGVVFIDINEFSDYAYRNTEKDVLFMLNMFIPQLMMGVRELEGYFEKNTGDGILAYFGAEKDAAEVAETVLSYYLTVQIMLHIGVNPILEDHDVEPISVSGGAAIGDVHISRIGIHSMNRRTAVSPTANVASKLEDMANTDQYYVDQGVHEHADDEKLGRLLEPAGDLEKYRWGNSVQGWQYPAKYYEFPDVAKQIAEEELS